jgi:hypothetical protein
MRARAGVSVFCVLVRHHLDSCASMVTFAARDITSGGGRPLRPLPPVWHCVDLQWQYSYSHAHVNYVFNRIVEPLT